MGRAMGFRNATHSVVRKIIQGDAETADVELGGCCRVEKKWRLLDGAGREVDGG